MDFQQSGTVDWAALASSGAATTTDILRRVAYAGVDPYTIKLASAFGSNFKIFEEYLGKIESQMINTRKFGFSADILFIGTGISVVPRRLAQTAGGVSFTAILVPLLSSFELNYSARVIAFMLRTYCPAQVVIPSVSQIESLGSAVSSSVRDAELGQQIWAIERLVRDPQNARPGAITPTNTSVSKLVPPLAESMASVIFALSTLAAGEEAIIRSPWISVSWIAAFAHRVLGLSVTVEVGSRVVWEPQVVERTKQQKGSVRLIYPGSKTPPSSGDACYDLIRPVKIQFGLLAPESTEATLMRLPISKCATLVLEKYFPDKKPHQAVQEYVANVALLFLHGEVQMSERSTPPGPLLPFGPKDARHALSGLFGPDFDFPIYGMERTTAAAIEQDQLLFGPDFRAAFDKISNETTPEPPEIICAVKCLLVLWTACLFLESTEEIQFDVEALLAVLDTPERVFRRMWGFRQGGIPFLLYANLSQHVFNLVAGVPVCYNQSPMSPGSFNDAVAVARGGCFVAIGTCIKADQELRHVLRFVTGSGGLFVKGKAVPNLLAFDGTGGAISPSIAEDEVLSRYSIRSPCQDVKDLVPTDSTKITLHQEMYAREGRHSIELAYHIYAREGIDTVVALLVHPWQITQSELGIFRPSNSIECYRSQKPKIPSVGPPDASSLEILNIEAFLQHYNDDAVPIVPKKRRIIMCHGNSPARVLATCVSSRDRKIKLTAGSFLRTWASFMQEGDFLIMA